MATGLENNAWQFRAVQKRLLRRYKDKKPSDLNNLDVLFHETYNDLLDMGKGYETKTRELEVAANQLACSTNLLLLLIRFKFDLDNEGAELLSFHLSPHIYNQLEQGWEETTDASMMHLLRTSLAKNQRDANTVAQPIVMAEETFKFKRHVQIVCDRLAKGYSITGGSKKAPPPKADAPTDKWSIIVSLLLISCARGLLRRRGRLGPI